MTLYDLTDVHAPSRLPGDRPPVQYETTPTLSLLLLVPTRQAVSRPSLLLLLTVLRIIHTLPKHQASSAMIDFILCL
jgi:hypothetical protein